jgi:hypothetical protein
MTAEFPSFSQNRVLEMLQDTVTIRPLVLALSIVVESRRAVWIIKAVHMKP